MKLNDLTGSKAIDCLLQQIDFHNEELLQLCIARTNLDNEDNDPLSDILLWAFTIGSELKNPEYSYLISDGNELFVFEENETELIKKLQEIVNNQEDNSQVSTNKGDL